MTVVNEHDIRRDLKRLEQQIEQLKKEVAVQNSYIAALNRQIDSMKRPMPARKKRKDGRMSMAQDLLNRIQAFRDDGISAAEMIKLVKNEGYKPGSIRATLNTARKVGQLKFSDGRYYPIELKQFENEEGL